jgi:Uma2 family endonuclease
MEVVRLVMGPGALLRWIAPDGPWTEPDLHLFPQDGHRYEIVDGGLHVTPPLGPTHESVVQALITTLRSAAPAGWWACGRLGIEIGASNLVPDVTVLRPHSSGAIWNDPADVALVIEVETPTTSRYDRLLKPALYAEAGIPAFWRVEPGGREPLVHIYTLAAAGEYHLHRTACGADVVALNVPFPVQVTPSAWA